MRIVDKFIPDRSRPGLPTTASGVAQQGTFVNYGTAKHSKNKIKKRGGRRMKRNREVWKGRSSLVRVITLNIGTMTGRGRELANMMERRNVNILCLQETKWEGSKAGNIGDECKLFYNGADGRKNGIGIVVREDLGEIFLEINNSMEEKNDFWEDLDGLIEIVSKQERIVLGADLNGNVGKGNTGDEKTVEKK